MVYRIPAATGFHYDRSVDDRKHCGNYGSAQVMAAAWDSPLSTWVGQNEKKKKKKKKKLSIKDL